MPSSVAKPTVTLECQRAHEALGGAMQPTPQPPSQLWTKRRVLCATLLIVGVVLLAVFIDAATWGPAYVRNVDRCALNADSICMDAWISFRSAVGNDTMHLLVVARQNGTEYWSRDYIQPNGFRPPDLLGWGVIIPVNPAVISSYTFQFILSVNGAQVDSRTVGWQGG